MDWNYWFFNQMNPTHARSDRMNWHSNLITMCAGLSLHWKWNVFSARRMSPLVFWNVKGATSPITARRSVRGKIGKLTKKCVSWSKTTSRQITEHLPSVMTRWKWYHQKPVIKFSIFISLYHTLNLIYNYRSHQSDHSRRRTISSGWERRSEKTISFTISYLILLFFRI